MRDVQRHPVEVLGEVAALLLDNNDNLERIKEMPLVDDPVALKAVLQAYQEGLKDPEATASRDERRGEPLSVSSSGKDALYCSFCGKGQLEVKKLIAGPTVFICDECIILCMGIIGEEGDTEGP